MDVVHAKPRNREGGSDDTVPLEELARVTIDEAFKIHRDLGPGLLESVYETVLAGALTRAGFAVERQRPVSIRYDGLESSDAFRIDLLVDRRLIVEIKSTEALARVHGKQLLTYLRLTKQLLGLLINFGAASFREGVKRVVNGHQDFTASRLRVNQAPCLGEGL